MFAELLIIKASAHNPHIIQQKRTAVTNSTAKMSALYIYIYIERERER